MTDLRFGVWWPGAGSNRRPSDFQEFGGGLSRPCWPDFVLSRGESSPVLSVVFGVRVSKSVSKIAFGHHAGLRTDPNSTRSKVTRCDAGTAGHDTGLKGRPGWHGAAGASPGQPQTAPRRRQRLRT